MRFENTEILYSAIISRTFVNRKIVDVRKKQAQFDPLVTYIGTRSSGLRTELCWHILPSRTPLTIRCVGGTAWLMGLIAVGHKQVIVISRVHLPTQAQLFE